MTDYYPLPGDSVSIPNSSTPSTVPLDGGTASGGIVKLTAGEWEKRAQVAADGAARLAALTQALAGTVGSNHFGDCDEGTSMYEALRPIIETWVNQLHTQAVQLSTLSDACLRADETITSVDASLTPDIPT
ncbi:hypothetical protein QSJ19_10110 [Gordonia sp. ABSL11-1]|uniref:hypothetical protein n=1 Tax=Gordonia sp. ABSL11-1 TaxID=3053924 RepID=UPI0025732FF1|nr:hypothetical protein [Gordonia sp. ABSL11-1]MDL9945938.1 hypothetical protein [Gordonia sp. ABSL11-1]